MKKDNSKKVAIGLVILTILVVVVSFILDSNKSIEREKNLVVSPSDFFTVNSCLYRTVSYVASSDTDSLLKVLDSNYKKKNNINSSNVLSKFSGITEDSTFVSRKMYYEKLSDSITKYYVYGIIEENILHDYDTVEESNDIDMYFIVKLDSEKMTFTIEPYDGEIFVDGDSDE